MNTINVRNAVQAAILPVVVNELTKGHWSGAAPVGHSEPLQDVKVKVDESKLGRNFDLPRDNWDFLNKEAVANMLKPAAKAVKLATGEELDQRTFRKELKDLMFTFRTMQGQPQATSHQGLMGNKPGRPSKADLEALAKPSRRDRRASTVSAKPRRQAKRSGKKVAEAA